MIGNILELNEDGDLTYEIDEETDDLSKDKECELILIDKKKIKIVKN
jgi:hypothetical protein